MRWDCTAARAAQIGLPRDLAGACRALRLPLQKDRDGHALMLRVSRPRTKDPITWWDDEARMTRMADYCAADVNAEALLDKTLPPLSASEREIWLATERLNDRGVAVDSNLLARLIDLAEAARRDLDAKINAATGGTVTRVTNAGALARWLINRGIEVDGARRVSWMNFWRTMISIRSSALSWNCARPAVDRAARKPLRYFGSSRQTDGSAAG